MAWKSAKLMKGKKPYRRWGKDRAKKSRPGVLQNPDFRAVQGYGHIDSKGVVRPHAHFRENLVKDYQHLPKTLSKKVGLYASLVPDQVPPMIQSLGRGYNAVTADGRFADQWHCLTLQNGELLKVHMMFSGQRAYFIEEDNVFNTIRRSITYKREKARRIVQLEAVQEIVWIAKITLPTLD